jgi:Ran GTPase-activating protein (RanGAP) involved in mRNA processing and transport
MLAESLKINSTIQQIKLKGTTIFLEGAVAIIAEALKTNCTIKILELSNNLLQGGSN